MTKEKKMFSRDGVRVETFPVREVKTYNQVPQVKQLGGKVELYTLSKVMLIDFGNILTARKFVGLMYELLTGQTAAQRGADKVRGAMDVVDGALGINTVDAVVGLVGKSTPGGILGGLAKIALQQSAAPQPASVASGAKSAALSLDEQLEALKKLKELLDNGIITQAEFESKKAQVMNG
ncbi:MAG: SHOCT domain-containing protein [Clostridiales bacterium]|nr:SHOCT domain-containing protein [Clostridiales bacterium]